MKSFAFIVTPITIKELKTYWPAIRILPNFIVRSSLKKIFPFKVLPIKKIQSRQEKEINGYFVICPLLHNQMLELEKKLVLDKIIAAIQVAQRLGSKIMGLDTLASRLLDNEYSTVFKNLKIPVTNGSSFSAWSVFEAIFRVAKIKGLNLKKSTVAIIDATDSVGSLCARKLSDCVSKLILCSSQEDKLQRLKETILHLNHVEVAIEEDTHKAAEDADIVIETPRSVLFRMHGEPTLVKVGLIKLPYPDNLCINNGLPKGVISSSLAETILLALEGKFTNYSWGENINLDKMEEIANIAVQHGFEVWVPEAPLI